MLQKLEVGQQYPGWSGPREGAFLSVTKSGLQLLLSLPGLTKHDIRDFKKLKRYGIYTTEEFPHGLIIWECEKNMLIETPFNPEKEKTVREEEIESFLREDWNALTRILIDENGIIKSLNFTGLDWAFINHLKQIWGNPDIDWSDYDTKLNIVVIASTDRLWKDSKKSVESYRLKADNSSNKEII